MMRLAALALMLVGAFTDLAAAKDPGDRAYIIRMLVCEGSDAKMELYVPQSIVHGATPLARALAQPVIVYERRLPGTRPHERAKAL
jgi:hypothetical protein